MKKHLLVAVVLLGTTVMAQRGDEKYWGHFGLNTEQPNATMDLKPNPENSKETSTSNEGLLIPRMSKTRVANMTDPDVSTLVYVNNITTYTGTDAKVTDISENGFYFYNGTKWVKAIGQQGLAVSGSKWINDATNKVVSLTNLSDGTTARQDNQNIFVRDNGMLGIGTNTPLTDLHVLGKSGQNAEILLQRFANNESGGNITISKAFGTPEVPQIPSIGTSMGRYRAGAYTGNGWDGFASNIETYVAGVPNANGTMPTNLILGVTNHTGQRNYLLKLQGNSGVGVGFSIGEDIKARLQINDWNDVTPTSTNNALMIGRITGANLVFDSNEIMARNNGVVSDLHLQKEGGSVTFNALDAVATNRSAFRNGKLGIGTLAPDEKLEVIGNVKAQKAIFTNLPIYASDTAADADTNLPSGSLYKLTNTGRQVFVKP